MKGAHASRVPRILTTREQEILLLIGRGRSNREIAEFLHVSVKDVEYHVGNLLRKLGCRNRTEAVSRAYALGYLSVGRI
jgi:DNA-binding NarL/FixJ family response regulator